MLERGESGCGRGGDPCDAVAVLAAERAVARPGVQVGVGDQGVAHLRDVDVGEQVGYDQGVRRRSAVSVGDGEQVAQAAGGADCSDAGAVGEGSQCRGVGAQEPDRCVSAQDVDESGHDSGLAAGVLGMLEDDGHGVVLLVDLRAQQVRVVGEPLVGQGEDHDDPTGQCGGVAQERAETLPVARRAVAGVGQCPRQAESALVGDPLGADPPRGWDPVLARVAGRVYEDVGCVDVVASMADRHAGAVERVAPTVAVEGVDHADADLAHQLRDAQATVAPGLDEQGCAHPVERGRGNDGWPRLSGSHVLLFSLLPVVVREGWLLGGQSRTRRSRVLGVGSSRVQP